MSPLGSAAAGMRVWADARPPAAARTRARRQVPGRPEGRRAICRMSQALCLPRGEPLRSSFNCLRISGRRRNTAAERAPLPVLDRRKARHKRAGRDGVGDARLPDGFHAVADREVAADADLAAKDHVVANDVLPAMPTCAASNTCRPSTTPWPICTRLSILVPALMRVSPTAGGRSSCWRRSRHRPRSRPARSAESSRACRRRRWAKPKPSLPITAPFCTTTREPSVHRSRIETWACTIQSGPTAHRRRSARGDQRWCERRCARRLRSRRKRRRWRCGRRGCLAPLKRGDGRPAPAADRARALPRARR